MFLKSVSHKQRQNYQGSGMLCCIFMQIQTITSSPISTLNALEVFEFSLQNFPVCFLPILQLCVYIPNKTINRFCIPATVEGKHWCLKCPIKSPQSNVVVRETFTDGRRDRCLPLSVDPQLLCSQYFWTRL